MTPELVFVEHEIDSYLKAAAALFARGLRRIAVRGQGNFVKRFMLKARELEPRARFLDDTKAGAHVPLNENTVVFLLEASPTSLSAMLMDYADATAGVVCAPITEHHMSRRAVMVNSVPKAGTHLLIGLVEAFGFQRPYSADLPMDEDQLEPGHYYNLQHMTREHLARPSQRMGRFIGAFCRSPLLFMIRDPRDVATSLAHYLSVQTDYHILQSYFANLPKKERLIATILGDYPLPIYINRNMRFIGTIRDLFMSYADWVRHPLGNTIILRFEDLIGPRGGGDHRRQLHSTWTAQLALHVPGSPAQFVDKVFSPSSITFRKGQIGSYKKEFGKTHQTAFKSLCPDYLELFGYEDIPSRSHPNYPLWRQFHGEIKFEGRNADTRLVVEDYFGFNVVSRGGYWYGFAQAAGPIDMDIVDEAALEEMKRRGICVTGENSAEVKTEILRLVMQKREQRDSELSAKLEAAEAVVNALDRRIDLGDSSLRETAGRLESELKDSAKRSDERLSELASRLEQRQDSLISRLESELRNAAKHGDERLSEMEARLAQRISRFAPESKRKPHLIEEGYRGFNLVAQGDKIWAVEMAAGALDFTDDGALEAWLSDGRLQRATTVDGARAAVDRLLDRRTFEAGLLQLGASHERQLTALTARAGETERLLGELQGHFDTAQAATAAEWQAAHQKLTHLQQQADAANARAGETDRLLKDLRGRLEAAEAAVAEERQEAHQKLTHLQQQADAANARAGEMNRQLNDLRGQFDAAQSAVAAERQALSQELRNLRQQADAAIARAGEADRQLNDLRGQFDTAQAAFANERQVFNQTLEHLKQQADAANARAGETDRLLKELLGRLDAAQAAVAEERKALAQRLERLQEDNASLARNPLVRLGRSIQRIFRKR